MKEKQAVAIALQETNATLSTDSSVSEKRYLDMISSLENSFNQRTAELTATQAEYKGVSEALEARSTAFATLETEYKSAQQTIAQLETQLNDLQVCKAYMASCIFQTGRESDLSDVLEVQGICRSMRSLALSI